MTPLFSSALLRTQSDERLLTLVGAGNERAFEAIVERYRRPLQRYCRRALSHSRSEDVVQQVLMKAWEALRNGAEVRSLKPWLFRIARTTILEVAQQPGFDYQELERSLRPPDGPDSELEQRAVIRRTLTGLAALPEAQREALLRTAVDGQSRAQIAEALGVSEGAVRQLLYRARASLRGAATAVTPVPFISWVATLGQGSPLTERAVEGGAAGSVGVAGLAKASALLAGAGVIAASPVAVHHVTAKEPRRARAHSAQATKPQAQKPKLVLTRHSTARTSARYADSRRSEDESRQESEQRDSSDRSPGNGPGESEGAHRGSSGDRGDVGEVSHGESGSGGDGGERSQAPSQPRSGSDSADPGDEGPSADSGSGSGDD